MTLAEPVSVLAAVLAGTAVWLAAPRRGAPVGGPLAVGAPTADGGPIAVGGARHGPPERAPVGPGGGAGGAVGDRRSVGPAVLAGLAPVLFLGGLLGAGAGLVVALLVHRTLAGRESVQARRRREAIARDLPHVVDLLGVALAAGAAPTAALEVVSEAVPGPVADELELARRGLALGRDPVVVWRELAHRPALAPLGRTMARAVETGASVSDALHRLAEDLQAVSRLEAENRARTVGVRAAAPLGLCLLPAFVLVGVVPLVAATVGALLGG